MPETTQFKFTYQEVAEELIKKSGVREGHWGLLLEFGLTGANLPGPDNQLVPAAIVPVLKIGIQRFKEPNPLTVDAAKVNPATTT